MKAGRFGSEEFCSVDDGRFLWQCGEWQYEQEWGKHGMYDHGVPE